MIATYTPYLLNFVRPSGTSRGVMHQRKLYFVRLTDPEHTNHFGVGECAPLPGLSIDDVIDYEQVLERVCTSFDESMLKDEIFRRYPSILFGLETALMDYQQGGKRLIFENNFKGVLPIEFSINTLEPGGALKQTTLQKINRLQKMLNQYPIFSKPLSVVDGIKFSYQAYHDNDPRFHILPGTIQLAEMSSFAGDMSGKGKAFKSFIDSNRQITRVSVQMADIGSLKMEKLLSELRPRVDSIFPADKYETIITGNSLIFLKGNNYMFKNLMESILLAILLISIIMVTLFMSIRMILISILPSIIPLIITAGLMGFFNISLKPSTIFIFSIEFGMSSDKTIYFLTKYSHEMRTNPVMSISNAVTMTIRETGVSMVYSSVILFFGFFIFSASDFGGTASLGKLLSITLLVAMMANIIVLPAFLLSLERRLTTKAFLAEPFFETNDEEEDIDRESLSSRKEQQEDDLTK